MYSCPKCKKPFHFKVSLDRHKAQCLKPKKIIKNDPEKKIAKVLEQDVEEWT